LLGVGECGNYSAGVKVISQWFPPQERALAGGLFNSGTVIGAFAAPPLIVWIASQFGWRIAFVLPSALGLLWIVPWLVWYREKHVVAGTGAAAAALWPLLGKGEVWGVVLMRALAGPVVHFYWYWLPEYLKRERGFTMEMIGLWAGLPFLFAGLGNITGGWFSGHMIKRGWSVNRARKTSFAISALLCLVSVAVPVVRSEFAALSLICLATFGLAGSVANHIGLLGDLFSPRVLARLTGLTGMCEGVVNMFVQLATGMVVDRFSYLPVFVAAGLMPVVAVACLFILVPRVEPVE
jgi:ACS family hexuronate transporter-like MFS transporter